MLRSLRARLTILMIVLVLLPLIIVGVVLTLRAQEVQSQQARDIESANAAAVAGYVEALMETNTQELTLLAQVHGLATLSYEEQETALVDLMAYDLNLDEVALLDRSGKEIIRITRDGIVPPEELTTRLTSGEYLVTTRNRIIYYGPVDMRSTTGTPLVKIGVPASKPGSNTVDFVLAASFRLNQLWDALANEDHGEGHQVFVVDGAGRVIAHQNPLVALGGARFTPEGALDEPFLGEAIGLSGEKVVMATRPFRFGDQRLTVVTEHTIKQALHPAYETRDTMQLAVVAAGLITALVAAVLLTRLTRPLGALANSARRLGAGDFSVRADERGGSELAAVGHAFNEMASQLASTVDMLEQRVAARTSDMQLASQLSSQVATILDPDELLPQVVELTKSNFRLYHAHVYLLDAANSALVLTAGAGEAGRIMRERGHRIALTATSLVARAARENTPVVVNDVLVEESFLRNPLLPDTRSEAAFPLSVRGRVVGVLDVQSDQVDRFDTDLQMVLQTMAGQIAVAIANAQLFAAVERASRHESTLGAITGAIQSAASIDDVLQTAARELGKALGVSQTAIELNLAAAHDKMDASAAPQTETVAVS